MPPNVALMKADSFAELLAGRDFEGLAGTFSEDVHARFLLPHGLEEHTGPAAVVTRIEDWFGSASAFELVSSSSETVGGRQRLSWRINLQRDGRPREVIEQLVFVADSPGGITQIDLLCSGFQLEPTITPTQGASHIFDAGAMGCADGLAQEFRRRLAEVPLGESLSVVVRDPAAKEDLPSLARMLGQSVTSVEAHRDGRLTINVERVK